jgi:hypothetical protein
MTIGGEERKFFLRREFPISIDDLTALDQGEINIARVLGRGDLLASVLNRDQLILNVAIAFCVDIASYAAWIKNH